MWFSQSKKCALERRTNSHRSRPTRMRLRPTLEQLEDRTVPSNFMAGTVSELIADINAANVAGGSNQITLIAGSAFKLNTVYDVAGLPVIAANNNLTIIGNGDTIERETS